MEEVKPSEIIEVAIEEVNRSKRLQENNEDIKRLLLCKHCRFKEEWLEQKKSKDCSNSMKDDRIYLAWMVFLILGYLIFIATLFFG